MTDLPPGLGLTTSPVSSHISSGASSPGRPGPESRVLIVVTGGTICMRPSPGGFVPSKGFLESALEPSPIFNDSSNPGDLPVHVSATNRRQAVRSLRTPRTMFGAGVRYAVYEFDELLDSSSIDAKGWSQIANTVFWNYTLYDAFVILHGTDSLAYTCSALSFMMRDLGKPVILTGSQAPMLELQNDATSNLLGSIVIAAHFMIPEVCLYFNNKLFRGNRTAKVNANSFDAFDSPNAPPLAVTTAMTTKVYWDLVHRPTKIEKFSIQTNLDTTHVACLRIFPGIKPEMVDAVLKLDGLRGLVLETFGAGNAPDGQGYAMINVLAAAIKRGIVIVNITQCLSGTVSPVYATGLSLSKAGVVAGLDMTTEAALTKLAYLLALPGSIPECVAREMSRSLRGELTESASPLFKHPYSAEHELLPEKSAVLAAIGYAVSSGEVKRVTDLLQGRDWLLNEMDYSGNTVVHLAAANNVSILHLFLSRGGSVHVRNRTGHTPLYIAANAGIEENVRLLRQSGGHLHADESKLAHLHAKKAEESGDEHAIKLWSLALEAKKGRKRNSI